MDGNVHGVMGKMVWKTADGTVGAPAQIRTRHLSNANQEANVEPVGSGHSVSSKGCR
jgi:hypothetical protein